MPFANSEFETERNGLTRAGQKYWKGPVGLLAHRKHKHLFLATLTATYMQLSLIMLSDCFAVETGCDEERCLG